MFQRIPTSTGSLSRGARGGGRSSADLRARAAQKLERGLEALKARINAGRERCLNRAERRVGRLSQLHWRATRLFKVRTPDLTDLGLTPV